MSLDRDVQFGRESFAGGGRVFEKGGRGAAAAIQSIFQKLAQIRLEAESITALTDSSGGAAGNVFTTDFGTDDRIDLAEATQVVSGSGPFRLANTGGGLPAGLSASVDYFLRREDDDVGVEFTLHLTKAAAEDASSTPVDITSDGTGTQFLLAVKEAADFTDSDLTGLTTGVTIASLDTAADTVMDAYATLAGQVNLVLAEVGGDSIDVGPGTDGSGTIGAIDDSAAANTVDTDATTFASAQAVRGDLEDAQYTVIEAVNVCRRSVGLADVPITGRQGVASRPDSGAGRINGEIEQGLDINQGAAIENAVVTDATTIASAVLLAEWDAMVDVLADNVALLADQLDAVTNITEAGNVLVHRAT